MLSEKKKGQKAHLKKPRRNVGIHTTSGGERGKGEVAQTLGNKSVSPRQRARKGGRGEKPLRAENGEFEEKKRRGKKTRVSRPRAQRGRSKGLDGR